METEEEFPLESKPSIIDPPKIHRLEESVVNRIAAGEVIQRPLSAVKELIENSLDASSTSINVVVKDGGLKLIQVSDDGHGIRYEDLPILCERHTTSKLSSFEDLQTISSMGFRGEALASMTYVAHVTVTTITSGQLHGYRMSYRDGVMENEPKACAAVKGTQIMIENLFYNMTARRKTLQNSADDYAKIVDLICRFAVHHINVGFSCRKLVLTSDSAAEFDKSIRAIHEEVRRRLANIYAGVMERVDRHRREHGAARADVHTVGTPSRLDAIRSIYGVSVARDLTEVAASDVNPSSSVFEMHGFISNSNYSAKKMTMVLFINDRLVDCTSLKRAIEVVYTATLPKASKPFVYMSIVLPPEHVDVNVHPTKREMIRRRNCDTPRAYVEKASNLVMVIVGQGSLVPHRIGGGTVIRRRNCDTPRAYVEKASNLVVVSLLNQENIVESIQTAVESKLRYSNSTRAFQTQIAEVSQSASFGASKDATNPSQSGIRVHFSSSSSYYFLVLRDARPKSQKVPVHKMVRTDSMDPVGRMHAYLQDKPLKQHESALTTIRCAVRQRRNPKETADLTSVHELLSDIDCKCDSDLLEIVKHCTYVGMADDLLALLQHNTRLYLVNVVNLSKELMYQQIIRRFGHFNAIQLSDPAPLSELIMMALKDEDLESECSENDDLKKKIAEMNIELLEQKAEILEEYFCISIDQQRNLSRIPVILDQYAPNMDHVPEFVLCLGNDVDWKDEKNCFQSIAAALGNFYAIHPPLLPNPAGDGLHIYKKSKQTGKIENEKNDGNDAVMEDDIDYDLLSEAKTAWDQREWCIQHVLFPSMRLFLKPPKSMAKDGTFVQVIF
ncbi:hypothetical protein GIB67_014387 [Kingdonia uniflora]|uniref:DNA mismatch repair protein S5 domain-containing protein n=1 Tax=Kingdonia uniflora TaxID=39325 RepID=A0A7J7LYX8_9MAGN|nr:hypothetical protein GIB67_014387 [Kingdonia uniflora]